MKLAELVKSWRHRNEMSMREAADEIGISHVVLRKFEMGETVSGPTLLAIMRWMLAE